MFFLDPHIRVSPYRRLTAAVLALSLALLSGCASTPSNRAAENPDAVADIQDEANDPLEGVNRVVFKFNDKADRYVAKPIARTYRAITPRFLRRGVSNFFDNLYQPIAILNNALQGKGGSALSDLGRFVTNSTVGVFGLFDVATDWGMELHEEDFGQTLGKWGVGEGPFLVLPFLGPSSLRDGPALVVDYFSHPVAYMNDQSTASKVTSTRIVDGRYRLLEAGDILDQAAGDDAYVFVREAYRQRRRSLVSDGGVEGPAQVDPSIFEDDKPK